MQKRFKSKTLPLLHCFLIVCVGLIFFAFSSYSYAAQPVLNSWTLLGLGGYQVGSVAINPNNQNILYAGTSNGVYKSIDGGNVWTFGSNQGIASSIVAVSSSNPNILYATKNNTGVQKSTDGGNTWTDVTNNLAASTSILDLAVDPSDSNIVYAALYGGCKGIWKTIDGGTTWSGIGGSCDIYRVVIDPSDHNTIYAGTTSSGGNFLKSTNGGANWVNPGNQGLGSVGAVRGITIGSNGVLYAGTEIGGVYKSINGGQNWTFLSNSPSNSVEAAVIADFNSNTLYAQSLIGASISTDAGGSWTVLNSGQSPSGVARFSLSQNALYVASNGVYAYGLQEVNTPLNVPLLKQTSNPWQGQEYDTAHLWSPANSTINRWGCAMTSAAMVFQYHGIKKLPDGTILDPGTLNKWLKNQPDGYVREGWTNWLALSRLSKLANNINGISSFDALEYSNLNKNIAYQVKKDQLTSDIENSLPGILEVPGHFIVGKGIEGNTFSINDPYYNRVTLDEGYSNTFSSLGRFVPSHTDLSYIMVVGDSDISFKLLDKNGNLIGESSEQQSIIDPENPDNKNKPISILYAPKPDTGNYDLIVSGNADKISTISTYLYDLDGNPFIIETTNLGNNSYTISFNKNDNSQGTVDKKVTFESVIADINTLDKSKSINHGLANSLIALVTTSQKQFEKGHKKVSDLILNQAINLLEISKHNKKLISEEGYKLLSTDFEALKELIK